MTITKQEKLVKYVGSLSLEGRKQEHSVAQQKVSIN